MSGIMTNGSSKAEEFSRMLKEQQSRFNPAARESLSDRNGNPNSKFPVTLGNPDPEDDKYRARAALVDPKTGVIPGIGLSVAPEGYYNYMDRKIDENTYVAFLEWIMQNADLSTPESAAYWIDMFPFIKEKMDAEIEREGELQKRIAKINAVGPQKEEDWLTLYMMNQGLIKPYETPLYSMNTAKAPYQPGLMSIFNMVPFAQNQTAKVGNAVTYNNPWGAGNWGQTQGPAGIAGTLTSQGAASPNTPNVNTASLSGIFKQFLNPWGQ